MNKEVETEPIGVEDTDRHVIRLPSWELRLKRDLHLGLSFIRRKDKKE